MWLRLCPPLPPTADAPRRWPRREAHRPPGGGCATSMASQTRAALSATASSTGWRFGRRARDGPQDPAVAVCCSSASVSARLRLSTSAIVWVRLRGGADPLKGLAHSSQNFACGRFSCWHRGHRIPSVSRVRIVQRRQAHASRHPGRRRSSASRPFRGDGRPDPTATRPRAPDGRFWGVVRPGACGETPWAAPTSQNSRLRRAPDGYAPPWRPDPHPLEAPPEPGEGDPVEAAGDQPSGKARLVDACLTRSRHVPERAEDWAQDAISEGLPA